MAHQFSKIAYTPAVKAEQHRHGSRRQYQRMEEFGPEQDCLGPDEKAFIESRDGYYQATVSETGWPYVQFRGGPAGFLHVLDDRTIAFADFRGNKQYISTGNLKKNDRIAMILMDYPTQSRLKILGHVTIHEASEVPELAARLTPTGYSAKVERIVAIRIAAFDWNCQQHITPRYTAEEWSAMQNGRDHASFETN